MFLKLFVLLCFTKMINGIKISAFNIQVFGQSKARNKDAMNILSKIILRYDIILIQEIRDKKGSAILQLLNLVNENSYGLEYEMKISERLGRTFSKEQYAFLYRKTSITIVDSYQFPDSSDVFEREPFAVHVTTTHSKLNRFVLIAIHIDPDDVVNEMNYLHEVQQKVYNKWKIDDMLIMGDLNAGCSYLSKTELKNLKLKDTSFKWLIDDTVDTTVRSTTDCAYDRFIMKGDGFIKSLVPNSAGVFHYDKVYQLDADEALKISDHYPIELELIPSETNDANGNIGCGLCTEIIEWFRNLNKYFHSEL